MKRLDRLPVLALNHVCSIDRYIFFAHNVFGKMSSWVYPFTESFNGSMEPNPSPMCGHMSSNNH